jgi:hypothetical protein
MLSQKPRASDVGTHHMYHEVLKNNFPCYLSIWALNPWLNWFQHNEEWLKKHHIQNKSAVYIHQNQTQKLAAEAVADAFGHPVEETPPTVLCVHFLE